jgi:imidazolonepropionase-like amidohydrolase
VVGAISIGFLWSVLAVHAVVGDARYIDVADSLGSIRPVKLADLVLLDSNPLADLRNTERISGVVTNGCFPLQL